MEKEGEIDRTLQHKQPIKSKKQMLNKKMIPIALIPLIVLAGMIVFLFSPAGQSLLQQSGNSLPEVTIERIEFQDSKIVAFLRNTGPIDVTVSQIDINDRIQPAAIEPSKTLSRLAVARGYLNHEKYRVVKLGQKATSKWYNRIESLS